MRVHSQKEGPCSQRERGTGAGQGSRMSQSWAERERMVWGCEPRKEDSVGSQIVSTDIRQPTGGLRAPREGRENEGRRGGREPSRDGGMGTAVGGGWEELEEGWRLRAGAWGESGKGLRLESRLGSGPGPRRGSGQAEGVGARRNQGTGGLPEAAHRARTPKGCRGTFLSLAEKLPV